MITYLLIDNEKIELSDEGVLLEEGMKIFIEENGIRKSYKVETIITILRKVNATCDPPFREIRLMHGE